MPDNATPNEALTKRLVEAWAEGQARGYLRAYKEVMPTLEDMGATNLLVQVVNNMLGLMHKRKLTVRAAAEAMLQDLESKQGKLFVMAAAVDVLAHKRKPGSRIEAMPPMKDTLALLTD